MRRFFLLCLFVSLFTLAASASVSVKVLDPQGLPVAGARVELRNGSQTIAVANSSVEGVAAFATSTNTMALAVFAAGFAPYYQDSLIGDVTIHLHIAAASQTVVVTGDATPLPENASGSKVSTLEAGALTNLNAVAVSDDLRYMPGAVINTAGQRGGLASLFVRGGESRYNKVIEDGVPVDDPGGTFDFGAVPSAEFSRVELVRGADSALYGSDAMTSVVQFFTRAGSTHTPELRFGADGGTFGTAHGYASLAGARGRFDFNLFGDQFNTQGNSVNDQYSNSLQGANVGARISQRVAFRFRTRHSNSRAGVPGEWNFEGRPLLPPDRDALARQNNFLASGELTITAPSRWQHRITAYEYNHRRLDQDLVQEPGRSTPAFGNFDFPFASFAHLNRAGVQEQSEYSPVAWARTIFGYEFEDENGFVGDTVNLVNTHGLRRNHAVYGEQVFTWSRLSVVAGGRFVHNESFGNKGVPRVAATYRVFGNTRLRAGYSQGIKEPRFEESFGEGGFGIIPNPALRPEQNRGLEAGVEQSFGSGRYSLGATYFNNQFRDMIEFSFDAATFTGQFVNVNKALAHGAEIEAHARPPVLHERLRVDAVYIYTSTQILAAPLASDPLLSTGAPLIRRPKHSGNVLLSYSGRRMGAELGGSFIGHRADSDFLGLVPPITHAPGYALLNSGGWLAVAHHVTAYANIENLLNRRYEEAVGYPGLPFNIRAGLRFRIGGE